MGRVRRFRVVGSPGGGSGRPAWGGFKVFRSVGCGESWWGFRDTCMGRVAGVQGCGLRGGLVGGQGDLHGEGLRGSGLQGDLVGV